MIGPSRLLGYIPGRIAVVFLKIRYQKHLPQEHIQVGHISFRLVSLCTVMFSGTIRRVCSCSLGPLGGSAHVLWDH